MTLENVIFQQNKAPYFIDCLDGDLSSIYLDIAKMTFDLRCYWSLRTHFNALKPPTHFAIYYHYLHNQLQRFWKKHFPDLDSCLSALCVLQAYRIVPYTQDEKTAQLLMRFIDQTMNGKEKL